MPLWNYAKRYYSKSLKSKNKPSETIIVPLSGDDKNLSSLLFIEDANDNSKIYTITNEELYAIVHHKKIPAQERENFLMQYLYLDYLSFGEKKYTNIPLDLFPNIKAKNGNDYKEFEINIKTSKTSIITGRQIQEYCVIFNSCDGRCHGGCDECPSCRSTRCYGSGGSTAPSNFGSSEGGGGSTGSTGGGSSSGGANTGTTPWYLRNPDVDIYKYPTSIRNIFKNLTNYNVILRRDQLDYLNSNLIVAQKIETFLTNNNTTKSKFAVEFVDILQKDKKPDLNAIDFILLAQTNDKIYKELDSAFLLSADKFMDADLAAINAKDPDLMINFGVHYLVKTLRLKNLNPEWSFLKCSYEATKELVHITLDAFGTVPVAGEIADITNGVLYLIEGDGVNATLSAASAVPVYGWAAVSTKYAIKFRQATNLTTKMKLIWKKLPDGTVYFGTDNYCRSQLRKMLSLAVGNLNQAHHIIPLNLQKNIIVQKAAKSGHAFHINDSYNGISLGTNVHSGSHGAYEKRILDKLANFSKKNPNPTADQCYMEVDKIIQQVRIAIKNNPTKPINQLIF